MPALLWFKTYFKSKTTILFWAKRLVQNKARNVIKKKGFQHGPASQRKLLYSLAAGEADNGMRNYDSRLPIPDTVLAEDELSVNIYKESGYQNVLKMEKIYRLEYLNDIIGKKCGYSSDGLTTFHLI